MYNTGYKLQTAVNKSKEKLVIEIINDLTGILSNIKISDKDTYDKAMNYLYKLRNSCKESGDDAMRHLLF